MNEYESIDRLLNPSSIAVVGASNNINKHGGRLIDHLKKHLFPGEIYPVNPKGGEIQGFKCYETIEDLPCIPDLACLFIAPQFLMTTLESCAKRKINMIMIHASGFAETGSDGALLQNEIVSFAKRNNIRICGPNTIGIANVNKQVFASFSMAMTAKDIPVEGTISYITQSGAIGGAMLSQGWEKQIGINKWISSGNEADLDASDYLNYVIDDPSTSTICVFLEGLTNGDKFKAALSNAANKRKPVIIYKNGRSEIGKKSVRSHTGVLAGNYEVYKAVFNQFGVVNAEDLEELFDFAIAFDCNNWPLGNRIGIISTSGGACTIVTDQCMKHGLDVPEISTTSRINLAKIAPAFSTPQNPFDTTAQILNDPESLKRSIEIFIKDENIDSLILMLTTLAGPLALKVASDIIELSKTTKKPMYVAWTIAESLAKEGMEKLRQAKIPLYPSAERAVKSVSAIHRYQEFMRDWESKKDFYSSSLLTNTKVETTKI